MDKDWYRAHGFDVSPHMDEAKIRRAETDVYAAYIEPIVGNADVPRDIIDAITGQLAYTLLLLRSIVATRAGAKIKSGYNSQDAQAWAVLDQETTSCHLALERLRKIDGVDANAEILDICNIYFKSNFFYI